MRRSFFQAIGIATMLGCAVALQGCATTPISTIAQPAPADAQDVLTALELYISTSKTETGLINSHRVTSEVAMLMKKKDITAYAALIPLRTAAKAGQPIDAAQFAAAQSVLSDFVSYVTEANGGVS